MPLGVYVHVPFCATRCGYCDFNTYTAEELGGADGVRRDGYAELVLAELALARDVAGDATVETVFFGGGTPTLLPAGDLARMLDAVATTFGLAANAEVTCEANPESVTPASLRDLRRAGFTRISLGMQSAAPNVLAVLDRQHTPDRAVRAAAEARAAGFDHVNLDLIYGTPGERSEEWAETLAAVVGAGVDHVSAYALIVEDGTRLAARIRRAELPAPDPDTAADRYLAADAAFAAAGLRWYEISNWAADASARCRHNLGYWTGANWWGLGPGAHSHIDGARWWNVKHPAAYAKQVRAGVLPEEAREVLTAEQRYTEDVMLGLRLADGLPMARLRPAGATAAGEAARDGLLELRDGTAVLTLRGRLLADRVVRGILFGRSS